MTRTTTTIVLAAVLVLVASNPITAKQGAFEIDAGAGLMKLDDKLGGDTGLSLDLRVGYFATDRFELQIQSSHASSILDGSFSALTANAVYHFPQERGPSPYILLGAGRVDVELDELFAPSVEDDATALRAAVGTRFLFGADERKVVRAELSALNEDSFDEDSTHIGALVSLGWRFGR